MRSSNGGQFEFLPVEVESAGAVFQAVLRLGLHAGFAVEADFGVLSDVTDEANLGAGIEVVAFANVAELTTNVTYQADREDCEFGIEQTYQFALGAAAGATVAVRDQTWGPSPNTSTAIYYTTMVAACAAKSTPSTTAAANHMASGLVPARKRQDVTTTTVTTEVTYTGVNCLSTGLINCPASLQNTSQATVTTTFVTTVPSGTDEDEITLPARVTDTVATTIPFGKDAVRLPTSSGSPVSYVPPPPPPTFTSSVVGEALSDLDGKWKFYGEPQRVRERSHSPRSRLAKFRSFACVRPC